MSLKFNNHKVLTHLQKGVDIPLICAKFRYKPTFIRIMQVQVSLWTILLQFPIMIRAPNPKNITPAVEKVLVKISIKRYDYHT